MTGLQPRSWAVLAAVALANFLVAALNFGLAAAAPLLRSELQLDEAGVGMVIAAPALGLMVATLAWGELADRAGDRRVLVSAFCGFVLAALGAAHAVRQDSVAWLAVGLVACGACGSAAHSAGGRAIAAAFPPERHGFVLALRHTSIPLGGAVGGIVVPLLGHAVGLDAVLMLAAAIGVVTVAILGVTIASHRAPAAVAARRASGEPGPSPLRSASLWLLAGACSMLAFTQLGLGAFLTVFLVDEASMTLAAAGVVFAATQLVGGAGRIGMGILSDRLSARVPLLVTVAAIGLVLLCVMALARSSIVDAALVMAAVVVCTSWNGVAVAAAVDRTPPGRTGATLGMQTTANAAAGVFAPVVLGVSLAHVGWSAVTLVAAAALSLSLICMRVLVVVERSRA